VKEKSNVSAWHGADNNANTDANANAPKVLFFMAVNPSEPPQPPLASLLQNNPVN